MKKDTLPSANPLLQTKNFGNESELPPEKTF